jgi:hypothetical protein
MRGVSDSPYHCKAPNKIAYAAVANQSLFDRTYSEKMDSAVKKIRQGLTITEMNQNDNNDKNRKLLSKEIK